MRAILLGALFAASTFGSTITFFNTGILANGTPAPGGSVDLHYTNGPSGNAFVLNTIAGSWLANNATSKWIGPDTGDGSSLTGGNYSLTYRISFTSPATSAVLTGRWSTDNSGTNILLNGTPTGNTSAGFTAFTNFTISGNSFIVGTNTLDFLWSNAGGPGGLRVEIAGTAADAPGIPEPASLFMMGSGLIGLGAIRLLRRRA